VTQFLIEEALYERLEAVERRVRSRMGALDVEMEDLAGLGGDSMMSPGEAQASDHAARMARLTGVG
jgi:hypothetical protein